MFLADQSEGIDFASQMQDQGIPNGATMILDGHSGGVERASVGSYWLGYSNIGVSGLFAEQGPGVGYFNNIGTLFAGYSMGQDVTSDLGAMFSGLYWSSGSTTHDYSWSNDPHLQGGSLTGNEWNTLRAQFFGAY